MSTITEQSADDPVVSFVLVSNLKGLCFNPHRPEPLVFESSSPEVSIRIRSTNPPGLREGFDNLECKSTCAFSTSKEVAAFVTGLATGRYEVIPGAPVQLPVRVKGEERINKDGRILVQMKIPFELYPLSVQEVWRRGRETLVSTQERFLRLVRWTQDTDGSHELYESVPALYWRSGSGDEHRYAPGPVKSQQDTPSGIRGLVWETHQEETIQRLWSSADTVEPVAHELLREARALADAGSHRSALLMAATAVETGVKNHIGELRPHTSWLLQNLQSPPIYVILGKYLPEMRSGASAIPDWKVLRPLWKAAQTLGEDRNTTAHKGTTIAPVSVDAHIKTASDVLYLLDVLAGHAWARTRVSGELREVLGWPDPQERRISCTWHEEPWTIDP